MTFQKTTPAKLKSLFAEAEASKAFLASKKEPKKTITDVIQAMVKELDAEIFELKNQEGKNETKSNKVYSFVQPRNCL